MESINKGKKGCFLHKAQSVVELATFGTLILIAFNFLLSYGQEMDNRQRAKMESFRRALARAYQENTAVDYTVYQDIRNVDLFSNYAQGSPSALQGSGSVFWAKGTRGPYRKDPQKHAHKGYFLANNNEIQMPTTDKTVINRMGRKMDQRVSASIWHTDIDKSSTYSGRIGKEEDSGYITNFREGTLSETSTVTAHLRFDVTKTDARKTRENVTPVYQDAGTRSSSATTANWSRSRSWRTPH